MCGGRPRLPEPPETVTWRPLDPSCPAGTYEIDDFLGRFTPTPIGSDKEIERAVLDLFRWDVNHVACVAYVRASREQEVEPARREAWDLVEALAVARSGLQRLAKIADPADFAARIGAVIRPKASEALSSPAVVFDAIARERDLAAKLDSRARPLRSRSAAKSAHRAAAALADSGSRQAFPPADGKASARQSKALARRILGGCLAGLQISDVAAQH